VAIVLSGSRMRQSGRTPVLKGLRNQRALLLARARALRRAPRRRPTVAQLTHRAYESASSSSFAMAAVAPACGAPPPDHLHHVLGRRRLDHAPIHLVHVRAARRVGGDGRIVVDWVRGVGGDACGLPISPRRSLTSRARAPRPPQAAACSPPEGRVQPSRAKEQLRTRVAPVAQLRLDGAPACAFAGVVSVVSDVEAPTGSNAKARVGPPVAPSSSGMIKSSHSYVVHESAGVHAIFVACQYSRGRGTVRANQSSSARNHSPWTIRGPCSCSPVLLAWVRS